MDESRVPSVALLPPSPTKSGLPPLPLLPPHWFSTKRFHDSPFHSQRFPYLQQIHTHALAENCTHLQQSPHILPPHRCYILNLSHCAIFSSRHLYRTSESPPSFAKTVLVAVRQNNFLAFSWDRTGVSAVGARRNIHYATSSDKNIIK